MLTNDLLPFLNSWNFHQSTTNFLNLSWFPPKIDFVVKPHCSHSFMSVSTDHSLDNTKAEIECSVLKQKKSFKIWFSPRSRKVRCLVEKPSEDTSPESRSTRGAGPVKSGNHPAQPGAMSIFNFTSSSQDSGSSSSPNSRNKRSNRKKMSAKRNASSREMSVTCSNRATRKQTKKTMKRNKLEAINQQWGITGQADSPNQKEQTYDEGVRRSTKKVSFLSPAGTTDDPQPEVPQASSSAHRPDTSPILGNLSENDSVLNEQTQSSQNFSPSATQTDAPSVHVPGFGGSSATRDYVSPLKRPSYTCKADDKVTTLETTPKRPRVSPARGRKSQISPAVLNPSPSASPGCDKKKRIQQQCESPPVQRSPCSQRSASGSPAILKRNYKGETPLHIASIKVWNQRCTALVSQKGCSVEHTDDLTIIIQSLENYLPRSNPCKHNCNPPLHPRHSNRWPTASCNW